jgi:two-component system response regulator NreC
MATQQITRRRVHLPSTGRERTSRDSRLDRAVAASSARRRVTLRGVSADRGDQHDAVKIVIADDHAVVRSGLRMLLDSESGFEVVAEAGDVDSARRYVRGHHPAVLVLDLNMPGGSSLEAIPDLREEFPDTQIVVLTMQDDPAFAREAMRAGALGYVLKEAADAELVEAVRDAAEGRTYLHPRLGARLAAEPEASGPSSDLSDREIEVLRLIALGHTNSEIAEQLFLSVRTVESHRAHIQQKLGLSTRAELVKYALDHKLLEA